MVDKNTQKTITLKPDWKNNLLGYTISVLLIPLFGIGFIGLYWVYKNQNRYTYTFSDTQISAQDEKFHRNIDLENIESVSVRQNWLQKKVSVGDIIIKTSVTAMTLHGMGRPFDLQDLLNQAISIQKKRREQKETTKPKQSDHKPGTMERMDYLTGLWQQGLVSDEDFEKEKKHFE